MAAKVAVILNEQSELRNLSTELTANVIIMRRSPDFARNDISSIVHLTFLLNKADSLK